jgi:hypothetical protein
MSTSQRLRLVAIGVAINGALALTLVAPERALATTCNPVHVCLPPSICHSPQAIQQICAADAPAGCTVSAAICTNQPCLTIGDLDLVCQYTAS